MYGSHGDWLPFLPAQTGLALDVDEGSGRDVLTLANRGWAVIAVEPAAELRRLGESETMDPSVQWLDDQIPDLAQERKL